MKKILFAPALLGALALGVLLSPAATAQPQPPICTSKSSCMMKFDGRDRAFCQAYIEKRSCLFAFNDRVDRGWCEFIKERKSCFMALDGQARADCEAGRVPREHRHWLYLCEPRR